MQRRGAASGGELDAPPLGTFGVRPYGREPRFVITFQASEDLKAAIKHAALSR